MSADGQCSINKRDGLNNCKKQTLNAEGKRKKRERANKPDDDGDTEEDKILTIGIGAVHNEDVIWTQKTPATSQIQQIFPSPMSPMKHVQKNKKDKKKKFMFTFRIQSDERISTRTEIACSKVIDPIQRTNK